MVWALCYPVPLFLKLPLNVKVSIQLSLIKPETLTGCEACLYCTCPLTVICRSINAPLFELLTNFGGELERLLTTWYLVPFLSCPSSFSIVCLSWLLALCGGLWFLDWLWGGLCTADYSFLLEDCRDAVR